MEMIEGIAVLSAEMDKEQKCEHNSESTSWKCKLDGSSDSLAKNIVAHCGVREPVWPAPTGTSINDCNAHCWPHQAHHLIPWEQLKKHPVVQWLSASPPVGSGKLISDNDYSVDHGMNGKFMPYVSVVDEWRSASAEERSALAHRIMSLVGIQLHQGRHSAKKYGAGEVGYKTRVKEYLDRIHGNCHFHHSKEPPCKDCQGKTEAGKLPPRRNVVRFMDRASTCLEVDINTGRIFVSKRAAGFVIAGGKLS